MRRPLLLDAASATAARTPHPPHRGEVWSACGSAGVARVAPDGSVEIMRNTFAAFSIHAAEPFIAFAGNLTAVRFDGTEWKGRRYG